MYFAAHVEVSPIKYPFAQPSFSPLRLLHALMTSSLSPPTRNLSMLNQHYNTQRTHNRQSSTLASVQSLHSKLKRMLPTMQSNYTTENMVQFVMTIFCCSCRCTTKKFFLQFHDDTVEFFVLSEWISVRCSLLIDFVPFLILKLCLCTQFSLLIFFQLESPFLYPH